MQIHHWIYNGNEVNELPHGAIGFIYCIYYDNGQRYIGKKLAVSERKAKPLKTQRKNAVRKKTVELKWREYEGSSKLTDGMTIIGKEILHFCSNNRTMTYLENYELFSRKVLESNLYINENIGGKFWSNCLDGLITI